MNAVIFWLIMLIGFIVAEVATMGLTTIWFAGGALLAIFAALAGWSVYTQIAIFMPQVKISRNNIEIISDPLKGRLYCSFSGINQIDYTHNTFNLLLFDETRQQA